MTPPASKQELYLVVVKPASPKNLDLAAQQQGMSLTSWSSAPRATVKEVKAVSPEAAADAVGVPPGATARVVLAKYVKTFRRAEKAPLVAA